MDPIVNTAAYKFVVMALMAFEIHDFKVAFGLRPDEPIDVVSVAPARTQKPAAFSGGILTTDHVFGFEGGVLRSVLKRDLSNSLPGADSIPVATPHLAVGTALRRFGIDSDRLQATTNTGPNGFSQAEIVEVPEEAPIARRSVSALQAQWDARDTNGPSKFRPPAVTVYFSEESGEMLQWRFGRDSSYSARTPLLIQDVPLLGQIGDDEFRNMTETARHQLFERHTGRIFPSQLIAREPLQPAEPPSLPGR